MAAPRQRINIELLLGISATFLSLAALIVSIFQTRIAREQQQASVWPYLQLTSSRIDAAYELKVQNNGVGPAIIKQVALVRKGKRYDGMGVLFNEAIPPSNGGKLFGDVKVGDVVKAGDEIPLLMIMNNDSIADLTSRMVKDTSFLYQIIYSDVYGNCWQLIGDKVTKLATCPN